MKFLYVSVIQFIIEMVINYNIDESHGLRHSLSTMRNAHQIYMNEKINNPWLSDYEDVILVSALVHDLCDLKYTKKEESLAIIKYNLQPHLSKTQIDDVIKIITSMTYDSVKKNGFPKNFGKLLLPYHITREADLMEGYDIPRSITYSLLKKMDMQKNITKSIEETLNFFEKRVFKHNEDGLFITETSKNIVEILNDITKYGTKQWDELNKI